MGGNLAMSGLLLSLALVAGSQCHVHDNSAAVVALCAIHHLEVPDFLTLIFMLLQPPAAAGERGA
jgi:hypothetical protein